LNWEEIEQSRVCFIFKLHNQFMRNLLLAIPLVLLTTISHSQNRKLHVKLAILPQLKYLFKDQKIRILFFDSIQQERILKNSDTATFDLLPGNHFLVDSCASLWIICHLERGNFRKMYDLVVGVEINNVDTTLNIITQFPFDCPYNLQVDNTCPKCKKKDKVHPICYGLVTDIYDEKGNIISNTINCHPGGCAVTDCDPSWYCKRDDYEF